MTFQRLTFFCIIVFLSSAILSFFVLEKGLLRSLSGVVGSVSASDDELISFFHELFSVPVTLSRLDTKIFLINFVDHSEEDVWRIIRTSQRIPGFSLHGLIISRGSVEGLYDVDLTLLGE